MRRPPLALVVAGLLALIPAGVAVRGAMPGDDALLQIGDAYIQQDDGGWTIGTSVIRYSIGDTGAGIGVRTIEDPQGGRDWHRSSGADDVVSVNGRSVDIGGKSTEFERAETTEWWGGVKLDLHYRIASESLQITRSYACYPGSAVVETWTTFAETGTRTIALSNLSSYAFSVQNATLNWITGMSTADDSGGPFTKASGDLDDGQVFFIGSDRRASEQSVPWYSLRAPEGDEFFGSFLWSGSWQFRIEREGDDMNLRLGLPDFVTSIAPGGALETPHAIFGMTSAAAPDTAIAMKSFIDLGLRHGRPMRSYVPYNTWYSYGTFIDEASMLAEMDLAAQTGVEQFVIDAGWWFHIDPDDPSDFLRNWGRWEVDPERFPNGLGVLADHAHALGMRFGVWVEPERVDLTTVGGPGLAKERFLATSGGRYDPGVPNSEAQSAQVCLVDAEAREWVLSKLLAFIDDVHPDYLKWDNNFWINCDRPGHGHGAQDGNFLHHRALQELLDDVHLYYPDLDIELCASGGNRLSLDMLAHTDAAWLDDRSNPSSRVRHNFEGLAGMFPPPYLLSFALNTAEGTGDVQTGDMAYVIRSRMVGAVGLSWPMGMFEEGVRSEISKQLDIYKRLRPLMQAGVGIPLGPQPTDLPDVPWSGWDAVQYLMPSSGEAAVLAFNTYDAPPVAVLKLKALVPERLYRIESADFGDLGASTGQQLMDKGIQIRASALSLGHVLFLHVQ